MEIWKDIQGYENLYQVSNTGKIKGLPRIDSNGRNYPERFLTPEKIAKGLFACLFGFAENRFKTLSCTPFGCNGIYPESGRDATNQPQERDKDG